MGHQLRNKHLWPITKIVVHQSISSLSDKLAFKSSGIQIWELSFLFSSFKHLQFLSFQRAIEISKELRQASTGPLELWSEVKFQQKNISLNFFHLTCYFVICNLFLFFPHITVFFSFLILFSSLKNDIGSISYSNNFWDDGWKPNAM